MNRREVIIFGATTLVFIITNLALRDILEANGFFTKALIGAFSAVLGFAWGFKLIRNMKEKWQLILTVSYLGIVLTVAALLVKRGKEALLHGTWYSHAEAGEDQLEFVFFEKDSSIIYVDGEAFSFFYTLPAEDSIVMTSRTSDLEYEWHIKELTRTDLVLVDTQGPIEFNKKIDDK